jgi:RimJ/RimL family protein N-acetyltransferase
MALETDRLVFRRPRLSHGPDLLGFLGDAKAMQYTFRLADLAAVWRHIAGHECQRRTTGFGPWTVFRKRDDRIVGFGGLYDDPFDPGWGPEIGYHFDPSVWGNGYASELTRFCLAVARDNLRLAEVRAFAHPDNAASRRVLSKAGFEEQRFVPELNRYLYAHRPGATAGAP